MNSVRIQIDSYFYTNIETVEKDCFAIVEEMAERVPDFNPFVMRGREMFLKASDGSDVYCVGVYSDMHISIARTTMEKGQMLPKHRHKQIEHLRILEGELVVTLIENRKPRNVVLRQYESFEILPGTIHFCRAEEKTIFIAETMPYSPYFPIPHGSKRTIH